MRLFILLMFIPFFLPAQTFQQDKLDSLMARLDRHQKFMGSVALYKGDTLLYQQAIGYVDTVGGKRSNIHTKYRIGSITKTFTAVLLMKAVESGKLSLEDKLSKWFPIVQKSDSITIRMMMGHRSGIMNFTDDPSYLSWNTKGHTSEQILEKIVKGGSRFSPGTSFEYSNSGYYLLGLILEKINGRSYESLLRKQILEPCKLSETFYGKKIDPVNNEARSFLFTGRWLTSPETDPSVPFSAGSIVSTPADICKFAKCLFEGKLLKPSSVESMKTFVDHAGLGLFEFPYNEKRASGHTGGIDGFSSVFGYFPDGKVRFALFSNGTSISNNDISVALLNAAYGNPVKVPDFTVKQLTEADLKKYEGVYASKQIPLKITFTVKGGKLVSQATGQAAFEMDALGDDVFTKDQYGIRVTFDVKNKRMVLKQGAANLVFEKE